MINEEIYESSSATSSVSSEGSEDAHQTLMGAVEDGTSTVKAPHKIEVMGLETTPDDSSLNKKISEPQ